MGGSGGGPAAVTPVGRREAHYLARAMFLALVLQFLLGMAVNLAVTVPAVHPGTAGADYFSRSLASVVWALASGAALLRVHVILGILIGLMAIRILILAPRLRRGGAVWAAVIGLVGVIGAGFNGASFLDFGYDFSSFLMSCGFAVALTAYGLGFLAARLAPGG
jgi:hypothetical protein